MTRTLPGADIRGYYDELGIRIHGWARTEASTSCFAEANAHNRGDRDPSCSVNLEHGAWHCHGCGARGGAYDAATAVGLTPRAAIDLMVKHGLVQRRHTPVTTPAVNRRVARRSDAVAVKRPTRTNLAVTELDVRHWQTTLIEQTTVIARLAKERGWLYSAMWELGLGYDCGRITIPVRDGRDRLVGLLRYRPFAEPRQPKMIAARGSRRALLPHPAAEPSRELLLVEGEPDMIAARSCGLPAIALPGVDAWRPDWARLFANRRVTIVMDADAQGRRVAERITRDLRGHAKSVVLDLAPSRDDGYDLSDWLLESQRMSSSTEPFDVCR
jgi:hypothetical protein